MRIVLRADFGKLTKAFEDAPEKVRSSMRLVIEQSLRDIEEYAREHHRYKTRTGNLERSGLVRRMVNDFTGVIATNANVPYAKYIHAGTKPHTIEPRRKKVLRWVSGGEFVFAQRVHHPGTKADPFLFNAAKACEPIIQRRLINALERIV